MNMKRTIVAALSRVTAANATVARVLLAWSTLEVVTDQMCATLRMEMLICLSHDHVVILERSL